MTGLCMVYTMYIPCIYFYPLVYTQYIPGNRLVYDILLEYSRYIPSIWQVYSWWLMLWGRTWSHAARATGNHITGPCHYCNSFRFTTLAHFTSVLVNVYCPFRHTERRKTLFFAQTAHKAFHLGQYRWPIRYKGRDSALWIGRKLPSIRPGATTVVALRSYDRIQHSNRPASELQKKQRKK